MLDRTFFCRCLIGSLLIASLSLIGWCKSEELAENSTDINPEVFNPVKELSTESSKQAALKSPQRVTLVGPKYLRPNSDYHVLINLANSQVPATVDVQLTGARDSNREQSEAKSVLVDSGETQTMKFSIGDWPSAEYTLSVNAQAVDRSWNFTQEATLKYQAKSYSAFIQTDKAIYKPGQQVQFRCLFLSHTLTPLQLREEINVTIFDAKRNLVKQWLAQSSYRGLLTLAIPLSEDPVLGDWTIKAEARNQEVSKQFRVAEYILPTYQVNIQLPSYATYNDSDIVATVRASYTYGKPVNGHVTLTVQPLVRFFHIDTQPLQQSQYRARLKDGSADISLDIVKDLKLERDLFEREIEFFALVEEDLSGRKYNKTEVIKIHDKNTKIENLDEDSSFKPGLSYLLKLKVAYQDETPVEDNGPEVELRYRLLPNKQRWNSAKLRPVGGYIELLIEPLAASDNITGGSYIDLQAVYRGQLHYLSPITPFSSESRQYMQIVLPQIQARSQNQKRRGQQPLAANKKPTISINDELRIRVEATEGMQQVTCHGLARGDIIWALSRDARNQSEFEFEVKVEQRWAPEARVVCFYVRPANKEIIADSVGVSVAGSARNLVKLSTSREEAKPGQEVEVNVQTRPNSLVGVLGIDQSVLLLKSGNDISQQDVANELKSYGSSGKTARWARNAETIFEEADIVVLTNNLVYDGFGFREGRLLYMNSPIARRLDVSAPTSLSFKSTVQLDSLILDHEISPPEFHINKQKQEQLVIRSFFPETWLWENATAGADGSARFKAKVPDTITSWVLSAFSVDEALGLGLSGPNGAVLRVFRPFFIKLNLPYSIIRGETVSIQAVIFNYSKRPTSAKVTLENRNGEFEFVEAANSVEDEKRSAGSAESRLIRIPAEDGTAVSFIIRPRKLGHIDIRLSAQSEFAGDGVVQKLLVKPEGQTQHLNKALMLSLASGENGSSSDASSAVKRNFSIEIPANAVAGSQKVFVSATGDILGTGLSNVDDLLRLPYGCGEQNMINLVPNIVLLNYLQKSKRLRESQRIKAVRNIETGYQRQLNYKRSDGSFSAFGNSDKNGSVWLTAYVLKTLQQAKGIITVDEKVIRRAANFIARFSRSDGSIEEVGMIHQKDLKSAAAQDDGGADQDAAYLTAYSMIALLQAPIAGDAESPAPIAIDEVLDRGLNYLEKRLESSPRTYDLTITNYALQLANRRQSADRAYEALWARAQEDQDFVWWSNSIGGNKAELNSKPLDDVEKVERESFPGDEQAGSSRPKQQPPLKPLPVNTRHSAHLFVPDSLAVEMSALALLSTVRRGELERALPIVKWLISQQNSNGGFASTQDTVLAIEALAAFAEAGLANTKSAQSIDIELLYPRQTSATNNQLRSDKSIRRNNVEQILLTQSNALVNQQIRLPDNITWVQVQATGSGSGVVQVSWQYNLLVSAERPAFYLNPILDKTSNPSYLQLSVCTYYKRGDSSNMAVLEVELPSGYVADVEALPGLRQTNSIKRIDATDGDTKVIVYIDKVTRDELCLTIPAHRTHKVSNSKPVPVSIYDYYNRQHAARIFYEPEQTSSCDICDSGNCSENCTKKPKRSERLISLHEQRRLSGSNPARPLDKTSRRANLTNPTSGGSSGNQSNDNIGAYQLLPLAPVFVSIVSAVRGLY